MPNNQTLNIPESKQSEDLEIMNSSIYIFLAAWFIILGVFSIILAYQCWPGDSAAKIVVSKNVITDTTSNVISIDTVAKHMQREKIVPEESLIKPCKGQGERFILISVFFGVLGGATHGFASLMNFRGQRRLFKSWSLWYFGRPILGGMMATIFYVSIRAGLFTGSGANDNVNVYGIAAFSAVVGMFTDRAAEKLKDVFDTLFISKQDEREGKLIVNPIDETSKEKK